MNEGGSKAFAFRFGPAGKGWGARSAGWGSGWRPSLLKVEAVRTQYGEGREAAAQRMTCPSGSRVTPAR